MLPDEQFSYRNVYSFFVSECISPPFMHLELLFKIKLHFLFPLESFQTDVKRQNWNFFYVTSQRKYKTNEIGLHQCAAKSLSGFSIFQFSTIVVSKLKQWIVKGRKFAKKRKKKKNLPWCNCSFNT